MNIDPGIGLDPGPAIPAVAVHPRVVAKPRVTMGSVVNAIAHPDVPLGETAPEPRRQHGQHDGPGDVHPGETTEEKISLSERFGLWLSFYAFTQDEYLAICAHWLTVFGYPTDTLEPGNPIRSEALQWTQMRGSRSGRVAWQFARDYAGRHSRLKK